MTLTTTISEIDDDKKCRTVTLKFKRPIDAPAMTKKDKKEFIESLEKCEARLLKFLQSSLQLTD